MGNAGSVLNTSLEGTRPSGPMESLVPFTSNPSQGVVGDIAYCTQYEENASDGGLISIAYTPIVVLFYGRELQHDSMHQGDTLP